MAASNVLHLGCSDAPLTAIRLKQGNHLHAAMLAKSPGVVGVDLSEEGIRQLQNHFPNARLINANVESLQAQLGGELFDLVIAGELMEHLSNPGLFLDECRKVLSPGGSLLITVPNAFSIRRYLHALFGTENNHPDHTFYFSENTLKTLISHHSLEFSRCYYYPTATHSRLKNLLYLLVEKLPALLFGPQLLEGLVAELKVKEKFP